MASDNRKRWTLIRAIAMTMLVTSRCPGSMSDKIPTSSNGTPTTCPIGMKGFAIGTAIRASARIPETCSPRAWSYRGDRTASSCSTAIIGTN